MLFNSFDFFVFILIVFTIYWSLKSQKVYYQNIVLLISSYVFYGWWDYRFLGLIFLTTIVDFFLGYKIHAENSDVLKKIYLRISILFNIGVLAYFKYINFFIDSWIDFMNVLGYEITDTFTLNIILPVGISFYTFQTLSYTIDVYNQKMKPTKDFIAFASFISFFPQLVAGPIERARDLLPQLQKPRKFFYDQGIEGVKLILWGLFKKIIIADTLAISVNQIYLNYELLNGGELLLGVIYFTFQIYCDFSGYSDIAIGIAKVFGIKLSVNFSFPYFSKNINVFWKRWHISLTSWFRDYLFIPLGGSRGKENLVVRNIFIVFIASGLWHGANWTFVLWGFIHFSIFIIQKYYFSTRTSLHISILSTVVSYLAIIIGWTLFRSSSVSQAIYILNEIIMNFTFPTSNRFNLVIIVILLFLEIKLFYQNRRKTNLSIVFFNNKILNITTYYVIIVSLLNSTNSINKFIYFQF